MSQTPTVVLPTDGSSTQSSAPQGAFRYQRGFYLITPQEMMSRGLMNNDTINCIGFTIGEAQSDTTKGKFKVYLQNTSNSVSRSDTTWTVKPGINTNYYNSTDIFPGNYEWQVKSNCSPFSSINNFSSINSDSCQTPTNLKTNSISSSSASLTWVGPAVGAIGYDIEYKSTDSVNWNKYSTVMTSYVLNSLLPNKQYNWRVKSKCATDSSDYVYLNFYTESVDVCTDPFMLMVPFTNDTSAKLLWIDSAADYYSVRFRRLGTSTWISIISFTDSILINFGLSAGTTYEWQVRSICGTDSVGQYVQGPNFVTTGATVCYAPDYFSVDSITASSAKFVWDQVS